MWDSPKLNLRYDVVGKDAPGGPEEPGAADADGALWARFAEADSLESFIQSWLALQCRMIPGVSGGMVLLGPPNKGPFSPAAVWPDKRYNAQYLSKTAERALLERRGMYFKREAGDGEKEGPDRQRFEVALPIQLQDNIHGVVVLDLSPRPGPELQSVLRQMHWGSSWLEVMLLRQEFHKETFVKNRLETIFELITPILGERNFESAAASLATALAARLECERVSLGFFQNGRIHVRAISHTSKFSVESNLARSIRDAMSEAYDQGAAVLYPPRGEGEDANATRLHREHSRLNGGVEICSIPLRDMTGVFGILTLERSAEKPFDPSMMELCEAVASVTGPMLEILRREEKSILGRIADNARNFVAQIRSPDQLRMKLYIGGAVALLLFLVFAKGDYRISAETAIEPRLIRTATAPFNGYIAEAYVRAGDRVRKGSLLSVLDDRELRLERLKSVSQIAQLKRRFQQAMAKRDAAESKILSAQIDQASAQLKLAQFKLNQTKLRAPFDGMVVTGDLSQSLGAPVEKGQVLFEIAPLDSFRVILRVDERYVADAAPGQKGELILSAFPTRTFSFEVEKITPVATAREGRNFFRVEARLLESETIPLQPGMEGIGKIMAGRRNLFWIWTRDITDWARIKFWSWLP